MKSAAREPGKMPQRRRVLAPMMFVVGALVAVFAVVVILRIGSGEMFAQATGIPESPASEVYTTAHRSLGEAVRHFFGFDSDPVQPIPFSHQLHVGEVDLECTFCHDGVTIGPVAGIPGISTCMLCHTEVATDREPVRAMVADYWDRGLEPQWERVYGWVEEDHVRFNHAPHVLNGVDCATCHGNVAEMSVAEPAVEHTMGFCMTCHEQSGADTECIACHY